MSPAGHWPQLHAAIEAGADAVYFGLHHFSARAKVGFTIEELPEVMRTLHGRGVRGYVTFNTLVFEHEIQEAIKSISRIYEAGADALIIQDIGIARIAREIAPEIEIHASTQMSITNVDGIRLAEQLGLDRVTLARELSLAEVRTLHAATRLPLEIFVHGALCVAYSGQCFSSEAWGGRSANRGQCAQACRFPYSLVSDGEVQSLGDARYLLSPGDLCTVDHVREILDSGAASLKIEGRYKDAEYVALATRAYRQAVDAAISEDKSAVSLSDKLVLEQVYSRGLGPWFASGTNHQVVVRGRAPRHRGVLLGEVADVLDSAVVIAPAPADAVRPLKGGDGVVFDAAGWRSPQLEEEGGRVFEVDRMRDGRLTVRFANRAVDFRRIRRGDLLWRTHDPDIDRLAKPYTAATSPVSRQPVNVRVRAIPGKPVETVWTLTNRPEVTIALSAGAALESARTPSSPGQLQKTLETQFGRLGGSPYQLHALSLESKGDPFLPVSVLNQLRRTAVERLQALQTEPPVRGARPYGFVSQNANARVVPASSTPQLHLLVRTQEQLGAALAVRPASITLDFLDLYNLRPSVNRVKSEGMAVRVATPRLLKPGEEKIADFLRSLNCPMLVRAAGLFSRGEDFAAAEIIGDFSLNVANSQTARFFLEHGCTRITPAHDLNGEQVSDLALRVGGNNLEVIAYHHLAVFHTEHCVFCRFLSTGTSFRDCGRPCEKHTVALRDDKGRDHPVIADVGCRNTVFGAEVQEASRFLPDWLQLGISHFRLEFTHETGGQLQQVARHFNAAFSDRISFGELEELLRRISPAGTTQGSLFVSKDYLALPVLQ